MLKLHAEARLAPGDCYDKNNLDFASKESYTPTHKLYFTICDYVPYRYSSLVFSVMTFDSETKNFVV